MPKEQNLVNKIYEKLCIRQWTIGFFQGNIEEIIRNKSFDPDIQWLPIEQFRRFFADPFILGKKDNALYILAEEFNYKENYGKILLLTFDESFRKKNEKVVLDTQSHLSYPYVYRENNRIYVFPEAGNSGKLSCYEYDPEQQKLIFLQAIIDLPLKDSTVLKYNGKYWIFATLGGENAHRKLFIFFSDNIMGPYEQHSENPVTDSLNGSRPAGNFIQVDGCLFRPAQNCENRYGESITINKVSVLNENNYREEPYMQIAINKEKKLNKGIQTIHTINAFGNIIVTDGEKRAFYPFSKFKCWLIKRFKPTLLV